MKEGGKTPIVMMTMMVTMWQWEKDDDKRETARSIITRVERDGEDTRSISM